MQVPKIIFRAEWIGVVIVKIPIEKQKIKVYIFDSHSFKFWYEEVRKK